MDLNMNEAIRWLKKLGHPDVNRDCLYHCFRSGRVRVPRQDSGRAYRFDLADLEAIDEYLSDPRNRTPGRRPGQKYNKRQSAEVGV